MYAVNRDLFRTLVIISHLFFGALVIIGVIKGWVEADDGAVTGKPDSVICVVDGKAVYQQSGTIESRSGAVIVLDDRTVECGGNWVVERLNEVGK